MNATRVVKPHRVLVVTRNLPPLIGGMERLIWHIIDEFSRTAEVCIVGLVDSAAKLPKGVLGIKIPLKPPSAFLARAEIATIKQSLTFKLELIFASSGLMALIVWLLRQAVAVLRYICTNSILTRNCFPSNFLATLHKCFFGSRANWLEYQ